MDGQTLPGTSGPDPDRARVRTLALVALCVLGLVVAAFALPPPSDAQTPEGGNGSDSATPTAQPTPGGEGEGTTEGDGRPASGRTADGERDPPRGDPDSGDSTGDGGGAGDGSVPEWELVDFGELSADGCVVGVAGDQVPGASVTVHVWRDGEPEPGVEVRFNGDAVGRTGPEGEVVGQVPYRETLRVNVSLAGPCRFVEAHRPGAAAGARVAAEAAAAETGAAPPASVAAAASSLPTGLQGPNPPFRSQANATNGTGTFAVDGRVVVEVHGDPHPGETATLTAAIRGVPMPDADVSVDGERVGRTDSGGQYRLEVPDDGTERLTVTVSRGDFEGSTTVDVLLLDVGLAAAGAFPLPGGPAAVEATLGGDPVPAATVSVAGRQVGTTGAAGRADFRLPADPTATVTVRGAGQTAAAAVWPLYVPTVAAAAVVLALLGWSLRRGYRRGGTTGAAQVGVVWLAAGVVVAATLAAGPRGGLFVVVALATAAALVLVLLRRDDVARGARSLRDALDDLVQWLLGLALRATAGLESLVGWSHDALGRFRAWLDSLPRSARGLFGRLRRWLASLPGRVVGVLALLRRHGESANPSTTNPVDRSGDSEAGGDAGTAASRSRPSLRERWRTFARWVVPAGWRRRTPGEVSRAAVEQGFPRGPTETLTRVLREIEYGNRPPTADRLDRAHEAFEALAAARNASDESGQDGESEKR